MDDKEPFEVEEVGDVTVVHVTDDMDLVSARPLKEGFVALMNEGRHHIIANLDRVGFIDSSGLETLASAHLKARCMGCALAVVCSHPGFRKLFTITGLEQVMKVYDSQEDAMLVYR